jgi:hypothetical protein
MERALKTIPGVPESITRADYLRLVESVGFDVKHLRQLEFRMDGIYASVMEPGPDGKGVLIDKTRDEVVVNTVFIPVREPNEGD